MPFILVFGSMVNLRLNQNMLFYIDFLQEINIGVEMMTNNYFKRFPF